MFYESLGLGRVAAAAVTRTFDQEVPLETPERLFRKAHLVMRQLKIASTSVVLLSGEVTLMSNSLFTFPVVLFIAVGGGVWGAGGGSFEMYLLII